MTKLKESFESNNFEKSLQLSEDVINLSKNTHENFWNSIEKDWLLNLFLSINKAFSNPKVFVFQDVETPVYRWKEAPSLISIDFSKPIVDIGEIIIEKPQNPIVLSDSSSKEPIDFKLEILDNKVSDTSATITARLTNIGGDDAHNVRIKFEVFSKSGGVIKLNGQTSITEDIGTLNAKYSTTKSKELCVGTLDGLNIKFNGGNMRATV